MYHHVYLNKKVFSFLIFILLCGNASSFDRDICSLDSCDSSSASSQSFTIRCNSSQGHQIEGHCCYDPSSDEVIAIDLSYCKLMNIKTLLHQTPNVLRLNFSHNHDLTYENTSFVGLKKLRMLVLDSVVGCPGQWDWFNTTWRSWKIAEYEKHSVRCINQTDTCDQLKEFNYTCPDHSICVNDGPGSFQCRCETGWGGYRCLRKVGQNLVTSITVSIASATVLLSIVLWYTERRHVL